jgi:alpha-L-arabinofuranosidase
VNGEQIPKAPAQPNRGRTGGGNGGAAAGAGGDNKQYDGLYVSATRDTASGDVILKLVNVQADPQPLNIELRGLATAVAPNASGQVLTAELGAMNSVAETTKVSPQSLAITNAGPKFAHELPGHSVSVIRLKTK